uniref:H15 domain-containing protein n=1 Tax=Myripristis murdjan TaxID=586833 RepID=A0A667WJF8_9TELE
KSRRSASARPKKSGPSLGELIVKAVSASKERGGVSLAALKKALAAGGYDVDNNKARVRLAVKSLVTKGTLLRTKGTGASGSSQTLTLQEAPSSPSHAEQHSPTTTATPSSPRGNSTTCTLSILSTSAIHSTTKISASCNF